MILTDLEIIFSYKLKTLIILEENHLIVVFI